MKVKIDNNIKKLGLHKLKYLRGLFIKSIIVVSIILLTLFFRKINLRQTNSVLNLIKAGTQYEFSLRNDGKRIFTGLQGLLETSIETLSAYNPIIREKYSLPINGTLYRVYEKGINEGIDIRATNDEEPVSVVDGIVTKIEQRDKKGYFVTIKYEDLEFVYGYLSQIYFSENDKISNGDPVGTLGTNRDGYKYLRLEIWKDGSSVDPLDYINME